MKKIILLLLIIVTGGFINLFGQTICTYEKGYSDFPFTSSGITFSLSGTGSFTSYSNPYTHCGITTKENSIYIGNNVGTFTITTSQYVNDMVYNLTCMDVDEVVTITVSNGTPTAVVTDGTCLTVTNNVIRNSSGTVAGGRFKVHSTSSFNSVTFSHNGSGAGSLVTMCVDAVFESVKPTVSTTAVSSVTGTTASSGGNVTADGGASVTARGVCWSTSTAPTTANSNTSNGSGTGTYTSSVTGLTVGTTYYLRAYATNSNGTAYGNEVTFTTTSNSVPTLSTTAISSITTNSASSGGNVTSDGGASVTVRGVCWNTLSTPTTANSKTTDGSGTGVFTSSITGLTAGTTYYVRAYATNSAGTGYGSEYSFTALKNPQTITFNALSSRTYGDIDFDPGATATSGLQVTYSSGNTAIATIVSNKVHIVSQGIVTIYADQSGNASWSAAPQISQSLTINKKGLTVTGATVTNKVYDGNTTAAITGGTLSGIVGSDIVTLGNNTTGTFASSGVGTAISVTSAMTLSGATAGNYTLSQPALSANITAKTLTVTGATATNKVYDGNTTASITGGTLSGVVGSDVVALANNTTGTFASAIVGTAKTVTSAMTLSGAAAGNYSLTQPTLSANITAKTLTVIGAAATNKVYDANTTAAITGGTLSGVVGSDVVALANNTTGTFASATVGTAKTVTSAMTLSGAASGNYTLTQPTLTANITTKTLTVTGATATNKVYDGNTTAAITGGILSGVVGSDVVTLANNSTGVFASSGVGTAINITSSMTLSGAAAGNYTLTQPALSANITSKSLTVTGATATNKVYDGNTTASITGGTLSGVVGSDVVTLANNTTGTFATAIVGPAKTVTSAMTLSGAAAGNYTLTQPTLSANITAKTLTVTGATATDKVYDGNTTAAITGGTLSGIVGSDVVTLANNTTGTFSTATVGTAKPITSAMTLSGGAAGNYTLTQPTLSANITAKTLTVTGAAAISKIYDGNTTATITGGALSGVVGSDVVTLSNNTTGTFATANLGTGIAVTTSMTLSGVDAANYTLTQPSLFADITNKLLTVSGAVAANKIYDGTSSTIISGGTLLGIVGSDVVTLANNTTGFFISVGTGTSIPVTTAMTLEGPDADLYTLIQPSLSADITPKSLTVLGVTATDKVYDGSDAAIITGAELSGIVDSDDVILANSTTGTFDTPTVGTAKTVISAMTLTGNSSANYTLIQPDITANITPKVLTVTGARANNKIYDGNTAAIISGGTLTGVVGSDDVVLTDNTIGTFTSPNIGTGIAVITSMTISGADAANYSLIQPSLVADITNKLLTVTGATVGSKIYDGNTIAAITGGTLSGIVGSDVVTLANNTSGTFASANAGTAIPVNTTMTIEGPDAGLYTLVQPSLTADITPKSLSATADNKNKVTGQPNPALTISYSGFITGEDASLITEPIVSTTAITGSPAGTYPITLTGGYAADYVISLVNGVLTVDKAVLTITADNINKVYGSLNPDLTLSYSGFVNGDDASSITSPSVATTATTGSVAGVYPIILTGGSASNYTLTLVEGTMTIDKAVLTVTAANKDREYGSSNPDLTLNYSGFVNGDNESALSLKPSLATSANIVSGVGTYSIIPSGAASDNYSISYVNGTLTVTKKMLTVTAENKTRLVNQPEPVFTMTYSGFAGNEGVSSITILPVATTTAVISSTAGTYPIIPSGGAADNYDFTYVNGLLLISTTAGDINGDGKITPPEIAGDSNNNGKIDGTEIAGDTDGDGKITPPEIAGDVNGDGKIDGTEVAGDINGDGKINGSEIDGDTNGDGAITGTELAGDTNGDGKIGTTEIAGDTNGDGKINGSEIAGDTNGDGTISGNELMGDTNGDGSIGSGEVSGDANGDGNIGSGETRVFDPQKDFPNINHLFTPNNDGINDYWILPDLDKYGISDVKVYNRWGKLVYSNKNYDNLWDGTSNGSKLPDGAYYYIIKTEKAGTITGTVNILR
jgi:trimeric autotransporter adhesin